MFMDTSQMVGEVQSQHTNNALLIVTRREGDYHVEFEGPGNGRRVVDILNLNGNACGMKEDSYIDFGGTSTKRVTVTGTSRGTTYAYVEVGE
jgi:hypothetical protein